MAERSRLRLSHGAALVILVSVGLLVLGQLPRHHPALPSFHFAIPGLETDDSPAASSASYSLAKPRVTRLRGPRAARSGSFLELRGSVPGGAGLVTVQGTYRRSWRTLTTVPLDASGTYSARIALPRRGLLHLRVLYPDGSRAVGSVRVR